MIDVNFTGDGWDDYLYWQAQDKKILRKINSLLASVQRNPYKGEGKPEPLKGENGKWSRRINDKDRLVYSVENDRLTVYQYRGHYEDK